MLRGSALPLVTLATFILWFGTGPMAVLECHFGTAARIVSQY